MRIPIFIKLSIIFILILLFGSLTVARFKGNDAGPIPYIVGEDSATRNYFIAVSGNPQWPQNLQKEYLQEVKTNEMVVPQSIKTIPVYERDISFDVRRQAIVALNDPWQQALQIAATVYKNLPYGWLQAAKMAQPTNAQRDAWSASQLYDQINDNLDWGTCGEFSYYTHRLLASFGIKSLVLNPIIADTNHVSNFGHVIVLVNIGNELYPIGPTSNIYYTDRSGKLLDYFTMLAILDKNGHENIRRTPIEDGALGKFIQPGFGVYSKDIFVYNGTNSNELNQRAVNEKCSVLNSKRNLDSFEKTIAVEKTYLFNIQQHGKPPVWEYIYLLNERHPDWANNIPTGISGDMSLLPLFFEGFKKFQK